MDEESKIKNGNEIRDKVRSLMCIVEDHYNYSGKQIEEAKDKILELWKECPHTYVWIDTNPYNEICKCKYCGADSLKTRNF